MPMFWIIVAVMVATAIAIVLLPLLRRSIPGSVARDQLNLAIHRERLGELKRLREQGDLSQAEYDQAVLDLERDLADDLQVSSDQASGPIRGRWAVVAVALAIPVISVGLYSQLGSSGQIPMFEGGASDQAAAQGNMSVDQMVASLEQKLRDNPDQPDGWFMLGRSYVAMKRYPDAVNALRRANDMQPNEPSILVTYAQALALADNGNFTGEPARLVNQALAKEPGNVQGLFLAGVASFQGGEMEQAVEHWRKVLAQQSPGSEDAQLLQSYIERANQELAQQGKATVPAVASSTEAAGPSGAAATGGASLSVQVSLAPELADRVKPTDTVFVFAVAVNGPRMPLAIQRMTAAELPVTVTLDDSMAMMPAARISGFPQVTVGARVSFSGDAIAKSGDLEGRVSPVTVAEAKDTIPVVISTPVP